MRLSANVILDNLLDRSAGSDFVYRKGYPLLFQRLGGVAAGLPRKRR